MPIHAPDPDRSASRPVTVGNPASVWIAFAATVLPFYIASLFPEQRLWGINWYGFFGSYAPIVLLGLALLGGLVAARLYRTPAPPSDPSPSRYWWSVGLIGLVVTGSLVLFHNRTHFLGDGYQLWAWVESDVHFKTWGKGTYAVHSLLYSLVGGGGREDAALALRLASWGSGLVGLTASALASCLLFTDNTRRLLMFAGLITGGYVLLFFGYFESYPLFVASIILYALTGLLVAIGRCGRFWILFPLALAGYFHIFAAGLIPSALYLLMRDTPIGAHIGRWSSARKWSVGIGLTSLAALALWYVSSVDYFVRFTIVPPLPDRFTVHGYTMFSGKHLLDYANLLVVLLPSLPLLGWAILRGGLRRLHHVPGAVYLLVLTLPTLAMAFIFNPGLGMPRDWDLFSFAGVPLAILMLYLVLSRGEEKRARLTMLLSVVLNLLILAPRVATQVMPEKSVAVFDAYAALDPARSVSGRFWVLKYFQERGDLVEVQRRTLLNREALPQEGAVMAAAALLEQGRIAEARSRLEAAIQLAPCYEYAWYNLGNVYLHMGSLDSALVTLRIADAMLPFRSSVYERLAQVYCALERYDDAENYLHKTLELNPESITARLLFVELYEQQHRILALHNAWEAVKALPSPPASELIDLVGVAARRGDRDEAKRWFERSRRLGVDEASLRVMSGLISGSFMNP